MGVHVLFDVRVVPYLSLDQAQEEKDHLEEHLAHVAELEGTDLLDANGLADNHVALVEGTGLLVAVGDEEPLFLVLLVQALLVGVEVPVFRVDDGAREYGRLIN